MSGAGDRQLRGQWWVVVADSPFLPATGGGEREHLGFVRAARRAGVLACLVVPTARRLDLSLYRQEIYDTPLIAAPRRTSPLRLAHPRLPFVVASRPSSKSLPHEVRVAAPTATGIVIFSYKSHQIGQRLAAELKLPAVLRQHNREGSYHRSLAAATPGVRGHVLRWQACRIERDESRLDRAQWLSGIADISAADAKDRRRTDGLPVLHVPPFALGGIATDAPPIRRAIYGRVLFLGALDIATNVAAISWFVTYVWPKVRTQCRGASLDVVGRAPVERVRRLVAASPGVSLHPDVEDTAPFLDVASVAVNPAVAGSGVNIKLVEYLQSGVPVVSTSLATQGLALRRGRDLEVHDDADRFAAAVVALLRDGGRAQKMAECARRRIFELLDPAEGLVRIAALLASKA